MIFRKLLYKIVCILLLYLILCPWQSFGQEKKVFSIKDTVDTALERNWNVKAQQEKVNQAEYVKNKARAEFLPKLSVDYGYTYLDNVEMTDSTTIPTPLGSFIIPGQQLNTQDNYQLSFKASQPLFTGFALISSYSIAKLGIDISEYELELKKIDIALQAKQVYFRILEADKGLDVARKAVESLESNVKVARSFYEVGMIPVNDLLKAEVELANARQKLVKAENAVVLAHATFNVVLARPINAPVEVEDIADYEPYGGDIDSHLKTALADRPESKVVDLSIEQAEKGVTLARSKYFPEIAVSYEYIKEGDEYYVDGSPWHESNRWQVTAGLTWTFWEWGKTYYDVSEKQSMLAELINSKNALEDQIRLEVKDALLSIEDAEKNIPATAKAVEQAEENLRVNEERYKAQVTTISEVLDAQTLLTQARTNYYGALYAHHLARAKLMRALGTY
jgi:outer membrane protein TolC